jgi:ubiquinone/menaquinone biosynthesis C-methylase UbiE
MAQAKDWDREYNKNLLVTGSTEPQADFKRFLKYLKRETDFAMDTIKVLDLGSGTGKNSIYLAEETGASAVGIEIAPTAVKIAKERAKEAVVEATFIEQSFGTRLPLPDNTFNLALDIMSSNSLTESERDIYLSEINRVLHPGAYFFVRLLALDGDKNAATLLKTHPGSEPGTYKLPEVGITERVLTEKEFRQYYEPIFTIHKLERKSGYARVGDRLYKRQYWIGYLEKK